MKLSFLISAWNCQDYIEECLDSLVDQKTRNYTYEILLAIDGCEKTLQKVKQIAKKYKNLRVFYTDENHGCYANMNNLVRLAKYDYLVKFDADDVANENLVLTLKKKSRNSDIIQFGFQNFGKGATIGIAQGVICFSRKVFDVLGNYKEMKCGADSEILYRSKVSNLKHVKIRKILFRRRIHDTNLTVIYPVKERDMSYKKYIYGKDDLFIDEYTKIKYQNIC